VYQVKIKDRSVLDIITPPSRIFWLVLFNKKIPIPIVATEKNNGNVQLNTTKVKIPMVSNDRKAMFVVSFLSV